VLLKFQMLSEVAHIHVCLSNSTTPWVVLPSRYRITLQSVDVCPTHYLPSFHFTSPYWPHNGLKLPPSVLAHLKITIVSQLNYNFVWLMFSDKTTWWNGYAGLICIFWTTYCVVFQKFTGFWIPATFYFQFVVSLSFGL
jgi:hypothetical protein